MIQPPINGPTVPPMLKPVVTIPNTRPNAPGGEAARTSISRDGEIMPDSKPAAPIAAISRTGPRLTEPTSEDQHCRAAEAERRNVAMPLRPVGDNAARQNADGESRTKTPTAPGSRMKETLVKRHQRDRGVIGQRPATQTQQHEEPDQADDGRGQQLPQRDVLVDRRAFVLRMRDPAIRRTPAARRPPGPVRRLRR